MKIFLREGDVSDSYITFAVQIGVDGFDFLNPQNVPGMMEQGYPDEGRLRVIVNKLADRGLEIGHVLPPVPVRWQYEQPGGETEVDNVCRTIEVLGKVGIPFLAMPTDSIGSTWPGVGPRLRGLTRRMHRRGYTMIAFDLDLNSGSPDPDAPNVEAYFERCLRLYERLVPIAEGCNVTLLTHPSDPPLPEAPLSPLRWQRLVELVPSPNNALLYCIGARYESGVNILDDIRSFGRWGKIKRVHFRNVRGSIPTCGGYEETPLSEGDMNMYQVLRVLKETGYTGALQVDHLPLMPGDTAFQGMAASYAVGYIRALQLALEQQ